MLLVKNSEMAVAFSMQESWCHSEGLGVDNIAELTAGEDVIMAKRLDVNGSQMCEF